MKIIKDVEFAQEEKRVLLAKSSEILKATNSICKNMDCDGYCYNCPIGTITREITSYAIKLGTLGRS